MHMQKMNTQKPCTNKTMVNSKHLKTYKHNGEAGTNVKDYDESKTIFQQKIVLFYKRCYILC